MKELVAVLAVGAYCFGFTYIMLMLINTVTRVSVSPEEQEAGVDFSLHGETAYEEV